MDFKRARQVMVDEIRAAGVTGDRVLGRLLTVPREHFVALGEQTHAYDDRPLPIGHGQTISQPYIVARMAVAAELSPTDRVLEVGTGSGYGAAVLSGLAARVDTIERHKRLAIEAQARLVEIGCDNVLVHVGDGTLGYAPGAPFDAIVVTAGGPDIPEPLVQQLAPGGRLIMPVGSASTNMVLVRLVRAEDGSIQRDDLERVAFVKLIGEHGWHEVEPPGG